MFKRCISKSGLIDPKIDFRSINEISGLNITEAAEKKICSIVQQYHIDKELFSKIPTGEVKKKASRLISAIEELLPVLYAYKPGRERDDEVCQAISWGFLPEPVLTSGARLVESHGRRYIAGCADELDVASYLECFKARLKRIEEVKAPAGKSTNMALADFFKSLHAVYAKCGGEGRGCYYDSFASEYKGPFYLLATVILNQVDPGHFSPSGVGKVIVTIIPA